MSIKVEKRDREAAVEACFGCKAPIEDNTPARDWVAIGYQNWHSGDGWDELKRIAAAIASARSEGQAEGRAEERADVYAYLTNHHNHGADVGLDDWARNIRREKHIGASSAEEDG